MGTKGDRSPHAPYPPGHFNNRGADGGWEAKMRLMVREWGCAGHAKVPEGRRGEVSDAPWTGLSEADRVGGRSSSQRRALAVDALRWEI